MVNGSYATGCAKECAILTPVVFSQHHLLQAMRAKWREGGGLYFVCNRFRGTRAANVHKPMRRFCNSFEYPAT
jgi:hypothetical protein